IVVLRPSYPPALREHTDVIASGVAAAFSVKLTLKAAGFQDAAVRLGLLRRGMLLREGTPRSELHGAFPFGLLALSHQWKEDPIASLESNVAALHGAASHPRELIDFVCVADLACATTMRMPYLPAHTVAGLSGEKMSIPAVNTGYAISDPAESVSPVATLITSLFARLAFHDPELKELSIGLRRTGTMGAGKGKSRQWSLQDVYSQTVLETLEARWLTNDEWAAAYL
ncbi:hypothetical protein, partial [Nocardioides pakistanensis]